MRGIVRNGVIIACIGGEDMLAGGEAGWLIQAANGNAKMFCAARSVKQARPAMTAKAAVGMSGRPIPYERAVLRKADVCQVGTGRRPIMATEPAALAAMTKSCCGSRIGHVKDDLTACASPPHGPNRPAARSPRSRRRFLHKGSPSGTARPGGGNCHRVSA